MDIASGSCGVYTSESTAVRTSEAVIATPRVNVRCPHARARLILPYS